MEVPPAAAVVCDFVNTRDLEDGLDSLDSSEALSRWLYDRKLNDALTAATNADLQRAISLREGLRALMLDNHDSRTGDAGTARRSELDRVARELPLRVAIGPAGPRLTGLHDDVNAGLAGILAAVAWTVAEGTWDRVKVCPADTCRWAFYDSSKNRSRMWCSMRICGNRAKTTNYRARQRSGASA